MALPQLYAPSNASSDCITTQCRWLFGHPPTPTRPPPTRRSCRNCERSAAAQLASMYTADIDNSFLSQLHHIICMSPLPLETTRHGQNGSSTCHDKKHDFGARDPSPPLEHVGLPRQPCPLCLGRPTTSRPMEMESTSPSTNNSPLAPYPASSHPMRVPQIKYF